MNLNGAVYFFGTHNLAETKKFYVDFLGLKLWRNQGVCHIYPLNSGELIGFCEHMPLVTEGNIITFLSDDVDEVYRQFLSANVGVDSEPKLNEKFNIYHFFSHDPNGYKLEIQKFLP